MQNYCLECKESRSLTEEDWESLCSTNDSLWNSGKLLFSTNCRLKPAILVLKEYEYLL